VQAYYGLIAKAKNQLFLFSISFFGYHYAILQETQTLTTVHFLNNFFNNKKQQNKEPKNQQFTKLPPSNNGDYTQRSTTVHQKQGM
jgi:hypothetical protein